jgi:hypothetical protein
VERGPAFAAEDLVTRTSGLLSTPRFDASAGVFGSGGIQPITATPENLSGSYTAPPAVREVSASVMVADSFAGTDAGSAFGSHAASGSGVRFSPQSTAASQSASYLWGDRPASVGPAGAAEASAFARHSGSLTRSSVFINNASGTSGRSSRTFAAYGSGGRATALGTVQRASSLTVYQALHGAAAGPGAAVPVGNTIESYNVAGLSSAAASVRMPMKVTSSSYGFLNSSLTVFSDDFGTFAAVGQTFNGLTSLNIAEPAPVLVVLGSLAGIAALRRRRRRL